MRPVRTCQVGSTSALGAETVRVVTGRWRFDFPWPPPKPRLGLVGPPSRGRATSLSSMTTAEMVLPAGTSKAITPRHFCPASNFPWGN